MCIRDSFHIENERDQTFIYFPELRKGNIIQMNERDFRPRDLIHRFSLFAGYELFNAKDFTAKAFLGPHYSSRRTIMSVSYTHLRAHETVLDLVCRLLLEQKNIS